MPPYHHTWKYEVVVCCLELCGSSDRLVIIIILLIFRKCVFSSTWMYWIFGLCNFFLFSPSYTLKYNSTRLWCWLQLNFPRGSHSLSVVCLPSESQPSAAWAWYRFRWSGSQCKIFSWWSVRLRLHSAPLCFIATILSASTDYQHILYDDSLKSWAN